MATTKDLDAQNEGDPLLGPRVIIVGMQTLGISSVGRGRIRDLWANELKDQLDPTDVWCSKCDQPATAEIDGQRFCRKHELDYL